MRSGPGRGNGAISLRYRSLWSFASLGSRLLANAVVVFIQAKILGIVDFGHLAFGLSCAAIWSLALDLGSILHALRKIAATPSDAARQIRSDVKLKGVLAAPLAAVGCASAWFLAPPGAFAAFLMLYAAVALQVGSDYNSAVLRALGRYQAETIISAISYGLYGVIAVVALWLYPTIEAAAASLLLGRLIGLAASSFVLIAAAPELLRKRGMPSIGIRENLLSTLPYAKDVVIANSMNQIDMAMAGWIFDPIALGVYAVAFRIFGIINQLGGALANIFIPGLAATEGDRLAYMRVLNALIATTLFLVIASLIGPYIGGPWLGSALGRSFDGLQTYLPLVGVATAARLLAAGSAMALTGSGLQSFRVRSVAIGLVLLITLGVAGGLTLGLTGYLLSGVVTFGAMALLQLLWFAKGVRYEIREAETAA